MLEEIISLILWLLKKNGRKYRYRVRRALKRLIRLFATMIFITALAAVLYVYRFQLIELIKLLAKEFLKKL